MNELKLQFVGQISRTKCLLIIEFNAIHTYIKKLEIWYITRDIYMYTYMNSISFQRRSECFYKFNFCNLRPTDILWNTENKTLNSGSWWEFFSSMRVFLLVTPMEGISENYKTGIWVCRSTALVITLALKLLSLSFKPTLVYFVLDARPAFSIHILLWHIHGPLCWVPEYVPWLAGLHLDIHVPLKSSFFRAPIV